MPFHHRTVKERRVALEIGHPQPVRPWRQEVPFDQVRRRCGGRVAACGAVPPAAVDALEAVVAHQPGDPFAADMDVQAQPELGMHAWRAIGAPAAGMDLADLFAEIGVVQRPPRRRPGLPGVVAGKCHTRHAAKSGELVVWLLLCDRRATTSRDAY